MLLLTAVIWGSGFVAQSVGMESVQAFTFTGCRMLIGCIVLLPFILFRDAQAKKKGNMAKSEPLFNREALISGLILGAVFFAAQNFQQQSFAYSTAGKIAFITALYMFFVPILGLFIKKRVPWLTWICVLFAFVGLWFISINPEDITAINKGDLLALCCSLCFAVQILLLERYTQTVDSVKLSFLQFGVAGALSFIAMAIFEHPSVSAILSAAVPILYAGVFSTGIAYTLQAVGQKYTEATIASLLMCMESVFAVIFAAIFLHEQLTSREAIGCAIMFAAIIVSQFSESVSSRKKA